MLKKKNSIFYKFLILNFFSIDFIFGSEIFSIMEMEPEICAKKDLPIKNTIVSHSLYLKTLDNNYFGISEPIKNQLGIIKYFIGLFPEIEFERKLPILVTDNELKSVVELLEVKNRDENFKLVEFLKKKHPEKILKILQLIGFLEVDLGEPEKKFTDFIGSKENEAYQLFEKQFFEYYKNKEKWDQEDIDFLKKIEEHTDLRKLVIEGLNSILIENIEKKVTGIYFSPDSQLIKVEYYNPNGFNWWGLFDRSYDLFDRDGKRVLDIDKKIFDIDFSPDSQLIKVRYCDDRSCDLFDRDGKKVLDMDEKILYIDFLPDSQLIKVRCCDDRSCGLFDRNGKRVLHIEEKVLYIDFLPDSQLIEVRYCDDGGCDLFDRNGKRVLHIEKKVSGIDFSPDNQLIKVEYCDDGGSDLFDRNGKKVLHTEKKISGIDFLLNGQFIKILYGYADHPDYCELADRGGKRIFSWLKKIKDVTISNDNNFVAILNQDRFGIFYYRFLNQLEQLGINWKAKSIQELLEQLRREKRSKSLL